jgi:hypothetical protein
MQSVRKIRMLALTTAFSAMCVFLAGCGKGASGDGGVSGKVTVGGSPVTGTITFIGSDSKEYSSPIGAGGNYQITNAPKGEYNVVVKGMGGGATNPALKGDASKTGDLASAGGGGTAPPAKYAKPDNGLKFEVTGAKQEKNFDLTP